MSEYLGAEGMLDTKHFCNHCSCRLWVIGNREFALFKWIFPLLSGDYITNDAFGVKDLSRMVLSNVCVILTDCESTSINS